jgi:hypothetical protein
LEKIRQGVDEIMNKGNSLKIVLAISIIGILFSGYLTYNELVRNVCVLGGSCPIVFNLPACVYGLAMYVILFIVSITGLTYKPKEYIKPFNDAKDPK